MTLKVWIGCPNLEIAILDQGQGFDASLVPDPTTPENLSHTTGRGLLLIRGLVDSLDCRRLPTGGMALTMSKMRPKSTTARSGGVAR